MIGGHVPIEVYVIALSPSREAINVALVLGLRTSDEAAGEPRGPHYSFRANPRSLSSEELDRAAQELVDQVMARIGVKGAAPRH
jgi:hypothetical protein